MPFLSRGLHLNPTGLAVDDGSHLWGYEELSRRCEILARRLASLGVGAGQRVALAGELDAPFVAALHAIWRVGGVAAPLNQRWTENETSAAMELLAPTVLLVGSGLGGRWREWTPPGKLEVVRVGDSEYPGSRSLESVDPAPGALPDLSLANEAVSLFTSGTSGLPSLVSLSIQNLLASAEGSRDRLDLAPSDRWLGSLSPAHVGGAALITRAAVLGSGLILRGSFHVPTFLGLVRESRITHASLVPTMLFGVMEQWMGEDLPPSLRCLLVGGAPAPADLVSRAVEAGFPVALTYGLTEASSQVATAPPFLVRRKPGVVGAPLPGVAVRIADDGEILVAGPTVVPGRLWEDGWLHTGDLGRMDDEGHLSVTGRKSDRIISGGVNVDPREVERALEAHPGVGEVVVVGVRDERWGERIVAVVVPRGPAPLEEESLLAHLRPLLSSTKRPRAVLFTDSIPRNPNGKVDRERIRKLFL